MVNCKVATTGAHLLACSSSDSWVCSRCTSTGKEKTLVEDAARTPEDCAGAYVTAPHCQQL